MSSRAAAVLVLLAACAPPAGGVITGRVVFEGETNHAGVVVSADHGSATTGPDGRFVLTGQTGPTATLLFVAQGSVEVSQSRVAEVGAELPDVVFQPAGDVTGTVVEAASGDPIPGALIAATGAPRAATSAADGTFTLRNVKAGAATVVVSFSGHGVQQKTVAVRRGVPADLGVLALGPSLPESVVAIAGRAVYADGSPAQQAKVHVTAMGLDRQMETGADGRFSFDKIRSGVVRLEITTGTYGAVLPAVLALEGTTGLVVTGGLFPLSTTPVELTRGTHLSDLTSGTLTPDAKTLVGILNTPLGYNLRAVQVDGTGTVDLLKEDEVGLSTPSVAALGPDSTTLAVALSDPSGGEYARQIFLASTVSDGRQLVSERACVVGALPTTLFYIPGAGCRFGGPLMALPLRFGAPASNLGTLSSSYLTDLKHLQLIDLVPAPGNVLDVDALTVGPTPSRRRIANRIAHSLGLSRDGKYLFYAQTYNSSISDGSLDAVEVATGTVTHLLDHANTSQFDTTASGLAAFVTYLGTARIYDFTSGTMKVMGEGVTTMTVDPEGSGAFLYRRASSSELGTLGRVPMDGGGEQPVAQSVVWSRASPDDTWFYFIDGLDLASRRGRLMRVALAGGPPQLIDADATPGSSQGALPVFANDGARVAYVRKTASGYQAVTFDAKKGTRVVLAELEEPTTWRWKFSPGARYLAFDNLAGAPKVLNVQPAEGGRREPVTTDADLVWRSDTSALFFRYSSRPGTGAAGSWHATFD